MSRDMEKYKTWHLPGDHREGLKRALRGRGMDISKVPLRRRFQSDDVLVTYRYHSFRDITRISLRAISSEEAISPVTAIDEYSTGRNLSACVSPLT